MGQVTIKIPEAVRAAVRETFEKQIQELSDAVKEAILAEGESILAGMGRKKKTARRPKLSASGRKSIAEAQRKRWAAQKRKQRAVKKKRTAKKAPSAPPA